MKFLFFLFTPLLVIAQSSEVKVTNKTIGSSKYGETTTYKVESERNSYYNPKLAKNIGSASSTPYSNAGASFSDGFSSALKNINYNYTPPELMEGKTLINVDLVKVNKSKYKYIAIRSISGWAARQNLKTIQELIINARKLIPLNALMVQNTKEHKISNELYRPEITMINDQTLVLDFHRTAINYYDRAAKVVLTNFNNEVVFEGEFINVPHIEMLKPILTDYDYTQEEIEQEKKELEINNEEIKNNAIDELKKLKELLDLGLLTQEEFDSKANELKKIILK